MGHILTPAAARTHSQEITSRLIRSRLSFMETFPLRLILCRSLAAAISLIAVPETYAAGVSVGSSSLIGILDYSDTFTGTDAGGRPSRPYVAAVQPAEAYIVENTYGKASISFDIGAGFSFAADSTGTPGLVDGLPAYPLGLAPNASGAGSDTGFTQTGGGLDYAIPYSGLRTSYVVQVDAIQVGDRIDISSGAGPGIFSTQSLSVFFRGDGSGNASLYNGATDTAIQSVDPTFNTGITGSGQWLNYAVRYDMAAHEVELFVNQNSRGVINLLTFAGGIYDGFSNQFVGAGGGLAAGENRTWTDNFQVGSVIPEPGSAAFVLAGLALTAVRRRSR
jgi:hypothetical protein